MLVKYIIPADGDEMEHPNVFNMDFSGQPVLGDIIKNFPLPGDYMFRFLRSHGNLTVWMDLSDHRAPVPTYNGGIFMKVSRITDPQPLVTRSSAPAPLAKQVSRELPPPPRDSPAPPPKPPKTDRRNSEKLLSFDDDNTIAHSPNINPVFQSAQDSNLLSLDSPISTAAKSVPASNSATDLFGLETLQPMPSNGSTSPMGGSTVSPMVGMSGKHTAPPAYGNHIGGPTGNPMGGMGMAPNRGMGVPQPGFGADPFADITGLKSTQNNRGGRGYGR